MSSRQIVTCMLVVISSVLVCSANIGQDCLSKCEACYPSSDTVGRLGCKSDCDNIGSSFTCSAPDTKRRRRDTNTGLQKEIETFMEKEEELSNAKDFEGMMQQLYADDCAYVLEGMGPEFGKEAIAQGWRNWFAVNPDLDHLTLTVDQVGENNGTIWATSKETDYSSCGELIGTSGITSFYKRGVNGELRIYLDILF